MSTLPPEFDFDALEAGELSTPSTEFVQKPTPEQIAECVRRSAERQANKAYWDRMYSSMDFFTVAKAVVTVPQGETSYTPGYLQKRQAS